MMVGSYTLHLIFYGLVAFVPDAQHKGLTILFPDARGIQFSSDGCRVPEHFPALYVASKNCKVGEKHHCEFSRILDEKLGFPRKDFGVQGSWSLGSEELSISLRTPASENLISPPGPLTFSHGVRTPNSKAPHAPEEATDFSWIPNPSVGGVVSGGCLSGQTDCPIAARFQVTGGVAAVCHLLETNEKDESARKVCPFAFKPLGSAGSGSDNPQAISDAVMVSMKVPRDTLVVLNIKKFDAEEDSRPTQIFLDPGDRPDVNVWVINQPKLSDVHDGCHRYEIDKHFELFYNLSQPVGGAPIPLAHRPIPHMLSEGCVSSREAQPKGESLCPILSFVNPFPPDQGGVPGDKAACGHRQFVTGGAQ